jgi:hypothetical protein
MLNATRVFLCGSLLIAGCGRSLPGGNAGNAGGSGAGMVGGGGGTGPGGTGAGGAAGMEAACAGAADPRLVIADQRILRLTMNETLNTVRYLVGAAEAAALVTDGLIGADDDSSEASRRFPPLREQNIADGEFTKLDRIADHVARYVLANFAAVTTCSAVTDACATAYLDKLAARAYRR